MSVFRIYKRNNWDLWQQARVEGALNRTAPHKKARDLKTVIGRFKQSSKSLLSRIRAGKADSAESVD